MRRDRSPVVVRGHRVRIALRRLNPTLNLVGFFAEQAFASIAERDEGAAVVVTGKKADGAHNDRAGCGKLNRSRLSQEGTAIAEATPRPGTSSQWVRPRLLSNECALLGVKGQGVYDVGPRVSDSVQSAC